MSQATDTTAEPLLIEIDHVAIAVRDLEAAIDYYRRAFGATVDHREVVESDGGWSTVASTMASSAS